MLISRFIITNILWLDVLQEFLYYVVRISLINKENRRNVRPCTNIDINQHVCFVLFLQNGVHKKALIDLTQNLKLNVFEMDWD